MAACTESGARAALIYLWHPPSLASCTSCASRGHNSDLTECESGGPIGLKPPNGSLVQEVSHGLYPERYGVAQIELSHRAECLPPKGLDGR